MTAFLEGQLGGSNLPIGGAAPTLEALKRSRSRCQGVTWARLRLARVKFPES